MKRWLRHEPNDNGGLKLSKRQVAARLLALTALVAFACDVTDSSRAESPPGTKRLAAVAHQELLSWGIGNNGRLADGTTTSRNYAAAISNPTGIDLADVRSLSMGHGYHSLAVMNDGTMIAWGKNGSGQVGDGTTVDRTSPVTVSFPGGGSAPRIKMAVAGGDHSLAVDYDGNVWAWGEDRYGQLGLGGTTGKTAPTKITSLSNIVMVAAGYRHSMALDEDGKLWAWGQDTYGQLGDYALGDDTKDCIEDSQGTPDVDDDCAVDQDVPVQIYIEDIYGSATAPTGHRVTAIAGGGDYSMALVAKEIEASAGDPDGRIEESVWVWGSKLYDVTGESYDLFHPKQVPNLTDVKAIALGGYTAVTTKHDGTVWSWGRGDLGQIGHGANVYNSTATPTRANIDNVQQIATGWSQTMALKHDGTVWSWGQGTNGQLGQGSNNSSSIPVQLVDSGPDAVVRCRLIAGGAVLTSGNRLNYVAGVAATEHEVDEYDQTNVQREEVVTDRDNYLPSDEGAQLVAAFFPATNGRLGQSNQAVYKSMKIELTPDSSSCAQDAGTCDPVVRYLDPPLDPKAVIVLGPNTLGSGTHTVEATLETIGGTDITKSVDVTVSGSAEPEPDFSSVDIDLEPLGFSYAVSWPVTVGVPFPARAVADVGELKLMKGGATEVAADISPASYWYPPAGGSPTSLRWVHVTFAADYDSSGNPASYSLVKATPSAIANPITVSYTTDKITVDTHEAVKFEVDRTAFAGVEKAWLYDGASSSYKLVLDGATGPYVVGSDGNTYSASNDTNATVWVEKQTAAHVIVAARGWYTCTGAGCPSVPGNKFNQFVTRIHAYKGQSILKIEHHNIITEDTQTSTKKIREAALDFDTSGTTGGYVGVDGTSLAAGDAGDFVIQERWDSARVSGISCTTNCEKGDGWATALTNNGNVTVMVRDFWQRYPNELKFKTDGLSVQLWPGDGKNDVFTLSERTTAANLPKLLYAHQGDYSSGTQTSNLNLKFPKGSAGLEYETLEANTSGGEIDRDPECTRYGARDGSAQGIAFGGEIFLRFHSGTTDLVNFGKTAQLSPHGRAEDSHNAWSEVEGDIQAKSQSSSESTYALAEDAMDSYFKDYLKVIVEEGEEYGKWHYGIAHGAWDVKLKRPHVHRLAQSGHYHASSLPWLLYFRGTDVSSLRWARAAADFLMNLMTVNYSDPDNPILARGSADAGAMNHGKGFTPWGAFTATCSGLAPLVHVMPKGHFVDPDALAMRYLMEGHRRAFDVYKLWATAVAGSSIPDGGGWNADRDEVNMVAQVVNYYTNTWDPNAVLWLHDMNEDVTGVGYTGGQSNFEWRYTVAPSYAKSVRLIWHPSWYDRLYRLRRGTTLKDLAVEHARWAHEDEGTPFASLMAWAVTEGGQPISWLTDHIGDTYDILQSIYDESSDSAHHGFRKEFTGDDNWVYRDLPYVLYALKNSGGGAGLTAQSRDGTYPRAGGSVGATDPCEPFFDTGPTSMEVFFKGTGSNFTVTNQSLYAMDQSRFFSRVFKPSELFIAGKSPTTSPHCQNVLPGTSSICSLPIRYDNANYYCPGVRLDKPPALNTDYVQMEPFTVPVTTSETGPHLQRIDGEGTFMPDFAGSLQEAIRLSPGVFYSAEGRSELYWHVLGNGRSGADAVVTFSSYELNNTQGIAYIRVSEYTGGQCSPTPEKEATLLSGAALSSETVTLETDTTYCVTFHSGNVNLGPFVSWEGSAAAIFAGTDATATEAVANAVYNETPGVASWGSSADGVTGTGASTGTRASVGDVDLPAVTSGLFVRHAAAGENHAAVALSDGTVWTWGNNTNKQLGDSSTAAGRARPARIESLSNIVGVAIGGDINGKGFSLALQDDGDVYSWGDNDYGQLGRGTYDVDDAVPGVVDFPSGTEIVSIAAGGYHALALDSDGYVWAWGRNDYDQLGTCGGAEAITPAKVQINSECIDDASCTCAHGSGNTSDLTDAMTISAGHYFSVATVHDTNADREVRAWGDGSRGQLGGTGWSDSELPVVVHDSSDGTSVLDEVLAIDAGTQHVLALRDDGSNNEAWAWGDNTGLELAITTPDRRSYAQEITFTGKIETISAGRRTSFVLLDDSGLVGKAWGENKSLLGINSSLTGDESSPTTMIGLLPTTRSVATIVAGSMFGLAKHAPPSAPTTYVTLTYPTGTISTNPPVYEWQSHAKATHYHVWVDDSAANRVNRIVSATEAGCEGGRKCRWVDTTVLSSGTGSWWVQPINAEGQPSTWDTAKSFTVP